MINETEKRKERDYLKTVLYILEKKLAQNKDYLADKELFVKNEMRYLWEEKISDSEEQNFLENEIINAQLASESVKETIEAHKRMIDSAYFARIDFDDGEEVLPVYIGIASLIDGNYFYVYDWRAPISSMFYDAELGEASYTLPSGEKVSGTITLKRQYVIKGDEIKEIFDTELQIIDGILQKMLSDKGADRMKNIVKTIQKEQNKIIRNNDAEILVVQGPAGSGKTSVAMHRIAYMLYADRKNLKNSNVLIISPNDIFSSYISDVLPSIGEENVYQTTYRDYVRAFANEFKVRGTMADVYECLLSKNKSDVMFNSISLKFSAVYYNVMEEWLLQNRHQLLGVDEDVEVDGATLVGKEFLQKYAETLNPKNSYIAQAELVNDKIISHLAIKLNKEPKVKARIVRNLRARLDKIRTKDLYLALYESEERFIGAIEKSYNELATPRTNRLTIKQLKEVFVYTKELLKKDTIGYEDVISYLFLKGRVRGFAPQNQIKHVVIDEAQDYTILQYNLLAKMFPNSAFTLLGDTNQSIMPMAQHRSYDSIINTLTKNRPGVSAQMTYLAKTYRSTYEINTFAKTLVADKLGYKQIERHGDKVSVVCDREPIASKQVFQDATRQKKKYNSVAIICKTEEELTKIRAALCEAGMERKFAFITKDTTNFDTKKVQIIPSYIAKGLEFDAVLVYNASEEVYTKELSNLFYVVCTRALHKLSVYYSGKPSVLLQKAVAEASEVTEQKTEQK